MNAIGIAASRAMKIPPVNWDLYIWLILPSKPEKSIEQMGLFCMEQNYGIKRLVVIFHFKR
ncbi:MAG: hypothetical protein ACKOBL_08510 [Chloroflexota bacterium]|jgi:hypothetical protein